jgi:NADH:ubiquinone oxidoreductase subunit K
MGISILPMVNRIKIMVAFTYYSHKVSGQIHLKLYIIYTVAAVKVSLGNSITGGIASWEKS